eukprot:TRINITY_DN105976_c0_g1_i1.p1 TRINITY_DN105976_c0_g1~~TRINITY_DN105976_c0_g1_i1.p1  ORF type:complete len:368 (+),score=61.55 TRINITY_DN105976_c0_g1_i1:79-1182(+)
MVPEVGISREQLLLVRAACSASDGNEERRQARTAGLHCLEHSAVMERLCRPTALSEVAPAAGEQTQEEHMTRIVAMLESSIPHPPRHAPSSPPKHFPRMPVEGPTAHQGPPAPALPPSLSLSATETSTSSPPAWDASQPALQPPKSPAVQISLSASLLMPSTPGPAVPATIPASPAPHMPPMLPPSISPAASPTASAAFPPLHSPSMSPKSNPPMMPPSISPLTSPTASAAFPPSHSPLMTPTSSPMFAAPPALPPSLPAALSASELDAPPAWDAWGEATAKKTAGGYVSPATCSTSENDSARGGATEGGSLCGSGSETDLPACLTPSRGISGGPVISCPPGLEARPVANPEAWRQPVRALCLDLLL